MNLGHVRNSAFSSGVVYVYGTPCIMKLGHARNSALSSGGVYVYGTPCIMKLGHVKNSAFSSGGVYVYGTPCIMKLGHVRKSAFSSGGVYVYGTPCIMKLGHVRNSAFSSSGVSARYDTLSSSFFPVDMQTTPQLPPAVACHSFSQTVELWTTKPNLTLNSLFRHLSHIFLSTRLTLLRAANFVLTSRIEFFTWPIGTKSLLCILISLRFCLTQGGGERAI